MLFGSSGIRRRFDQALMDIALGVGNVLAAGSSEILLGMDTRTTSPLLSHLIISGIISNGGTARFAGIVPTPTVAFSSRFATSGCMITASHNPEEYNGIKLFNPDGSSYTRAQQQKTEAALSSLTYSDWQNLGKVCATDACTPHKKAILDKVSIGRKISVIVDCGNGAGSTLTPSLMTDADISTVLINCNPVGTFARPSEPLPEYLGYIGDMVSKHLADCAVVHDGDADRMMAFDNKGRYIGGDHLLMLFARYLDAKRVVTTSDASMIIDEIAEVHRTPVGDAFVSEELISWGDFGGEPSGAWIFPQISLCPDGPFAAALLCEIASEWDIAEEIDAMPHYPVLRESFKTDAAEEILISLGASNPTEGIRISDDDGWYLVRASGTEPKIRVTAEGRTREKAKFMLEKGKELIRQGKTA
ncbi:MAG TPA: phosphopentomutase/phosphoglucosamine mutase [Methanoregula sp.]|nr:phosphopentomutase/phosphoglucosamine mutase [Methanoregula sp.]